MLESLIGMARIAMSRIRARCWKLRGAKVSNKVSVGARSRLDHPSGLRLRERVTIESDVWFKLVSAKATLALDTFSFVGRGTEIDVAERVMIGSNVLIAPRVFITDHAHNIEEGRMINEQGCSSSPVQIGNDVWIGTAATILPGVSIGDGAVIGAGAVVRSDIPSNEIWAGVPARKIRDR